MFVREARYDEFRTCPTWKSLARFHSWAFLLDPSSERRLHALASIGIIVGKPIGIRKAQLQHRYRSCDGRRRDHVAIGVGGASVVASQFGARTDRVREGQSHLDSHRLALGLRHTLRASFSR